MNTNIRQYTKNILHVLNDVFRGNCVRITALTLEVITIKYNMLFVIANYAIWCELKVLNHLT